MKTILLLGAGMGSPDVVARLKSLGLKIVLVELRHLFDMKKAAPADEIILTDYREEGFCRLAARLHETWAFDAVLSITEAGVAVAAGLNRRFGLRGSDEKAIACLNDKAQMRALLHEHAFSQIAYTVLRERSEIAGFAARAGFPLILKPVDGGGSRGIHKVNSVEQAQAAFDSLRADGFTVLAEEYIDGREYSVESFSFNGVHNIVAITEKMVNERFVEIGHLVPARLDGAYAEAVKRFVREFLSLVGVTNGPCHTEMKIGSKGLKIIESHNRIGGGNIPKLVLLAHGVDLIKLTGQWACDMIAPAVVPQPAYGAAAIHFLVFPAGKIAELDGLRQIESNPSTIEYSCLYRKGDTVPAMIDNSGRSGYVIVQEASAEAAMEQAKRLARGVVVTSSVDEGVAIS
jgi:biotin carboxylase